MHTVYGPEDKGAYYRADALGHKQLIEHYLKVLKGISLQHVEETLSDSKCNREDESKFNGLFFSALVFFNYNVLLCELAGVYRFISFVLSILKVGFCTYFLRLMMASSEHMSVRIRRMRLFVL